MTDTVRTKTKQEGLYGLYAVILTILFKAPVEMILEKGVL